MKINFNVENSGIGVQGNKKNSLISLMLILIESTMNDILFSPIRLSELEILIQNAVRKALIETRKEQSDHPETGQFLTIKEAAAFLHLSVQTIYGYVSRSAIPVSKRGKRLYFSKQELIDWIKTGRKKTIAEINTEVNSYLIKKNK